MKSQTTLQLLQPARFSRCWRSCGAGDDDAFGVLVGAYCEPHRHYHTASHVAECLAGLDRHRGLAARPEELEVALYFHDLVYQPAAPDNEARSAARLRDLGRVAGVSTEAAARIARLIEATACHLESEGDAALVIDLDLSVLGATPARYARYEEDIRREYAAFDARQYAEGRALILDGFLRRPRIYQTPDLAALLEERARTNLARALGALRSTIMEV